MKRILLLLGAILMLSAPAFSQNESENDDDDEYVQNEFNYTTNGRGDQYLKIAIMGNWPLNFGEQLYTGMAANLGFYTFVNPWIALGGDLMVGYNPTLGSNSLMFVPITFGVMVQPTLWKFEFPITTSVGFAFESCQNKKYFPGFTGKLDAGAFFRMNESWSFGLGSEFLYLPQWYTTTENADSDYGLFLTGYVCARYHF